jgi:hypothetical protein
MTTLDMLLELNLGWNPDTSRLQDLIEAATASVPVLAWLLDNDAPINWDSMVWAASRRRGQNPGVAAWLEQRWYPLHTLWKRVRVRAVGLADARVRALSRAALSRDTCLCRLASESLMRLVRHRLQELEGEAKAARAEAASKAAELAAVKAELSATKFELSTLGTAVRQLQAMAGLASTV